MFRTLGQVCLILLTLSAISFSQKVTVGYDKSVDFLKYKSYTWAQSTTPTTRPILYLTVVGAIDYELKAKGLENVEKEGDLILIPSGGMDFGFNTAAGTPILPSYSGVPPGINATMWTGAGAPSNPMAPYVAEGTLMLNFVDRVANKVVWTGTVKEKLDIENKKKSLERVDRAITKLFSQFPPRKK